MTDSALEAFQLYANFLTEEAARRSQVPLLTSLESKGRSHWEKRPSHSGGGIYSTSNRVSHMTQAKI
eukprot:CCRYP_005672-RA/>CCRYP_005672-RA protein AED:0.43 eAED:0.43 QI:0/-1/0/1/-1/1/1/0/66